MRITGAVGRLEVALHEPEGAPKLGVLVSHPHPLFGGTMENATVRAVAEACAGRGAVALRYNYRGVGESEGEYAGVSGGAEDALAALRFLRERAPGKPIALAGYSFGSRVTLELLKAGESPRAVALLGLPLRGADGIEPDWRAFEKYDGPVLVVQGERDEFGTPDEIRPHLPANARLHAVARAGHFFTGKWGAVGEVVAEFLSG